MSSNFSAQAGFPGAHHSELCPGSFEYFPWGKSTASLDNLFQRVVTCTVKNFFLIFRWNFLFINCLSLLSTTKESWSILLTPFPQIFTDTDEVPSPWTGPAPSAVPFKRDAPLPDNLCSPIDALKYLKFSWICTSNSYLLRKKPELKKFC